MTDQRKSEMTGDRPGTRTAADDHNREETAHSDGRPHHGRLSKDPKGVFAARQQSGPNGERDFSNSPGRVSEVPRKMGKRRGPVT